MKVYKFEELFTEEGNGDLLLTFPEEFGTMFKDGEQVTIEVVDGNLVIKKYDQSKDQTTSNI